MSRAISGITNTASQSIDTLVSVVNTIAQAISTEVVTANSAANGALTVGNGFVSGIFGASVSVGLTFRGGSVSTPADGQWTSNVVITTPNDKFYVGNTSVFSSMNSTFIVGANGQFSTANVGYFNQSSLNFANTVMADLVKTTTGTSVQTFDSFGLGLYRSAEYLLSVTDNTSAAYSVSKILIVHDGSTPLFTEYGLLSTNGTSLITWSATANATSVILSAQPLTSSLTIRAVRTSLKP
jgi:hypothetical protein